MSEHQAAPNSPLTEGHAGLLSQLQEAHRRLEELRSSSTEEHEGALGWCEQARRLILQQREVVLWEIQEEQSELEQLLAALSRDNHTSLQEGLAEIGRQQEQLSLLSRELEASAGLAGDRALGTDIHRQLAHILSPGRRVDITLRRPRFVPRLQRGLKLGEIVPEERSVRLPRPSPCPGAEAGGSPAAGGLNRVSVPEIRTSSGQATFTRTLHVNCTAPGAGDHQSLSPTGGPTAGRASPDSGEGEGGRNGDDAGMREETLALQRWRTGRTALGPGNKTSPPLPSPHRGRDGAVPAKGPGTEGCARFLSPCLTGKGDVPECCPAAEPATVPSSDGLGEEGVRRPLMASARDQALEGAGLSTPRCPGAQASGQATTGSPRGPEPSSSPVTPNHQTHPAGDPEPVGAPHPGGEDAPDPGRGPSPTPAHQRTSVHTTNLHNPSLQVRSRHCPGDQDHLTGDPLPASQTPHPPDGGSVYRATAVFISDGDSDGSSPTGGIGVADRRQTGGGPEPCHPPAAGHAPCAWGEDSPLSRSGRSPETASGARAKAGRPGRVRGRGASGRSRFRRKAFSQSCLDLTATEAPVMAPRPWECPEPARPDTRSPTSSSLTGSLDSTETFLIDSPRGFGEREGMAGAARAPDSPRAAAHRPRSRVSRTSGPQPHQGAAPPHRRARSPRAPPTGQHPSPAADRVKPPGQGPPLRPKSMVRDGKAPAPKGAALRSGSSLGPGCSGAWTERGSWSRSPGAGSPPAAPPCLGTRGRSRSEANLSARPGPGPFLRNQLVGQFGSSGCGSGGLSLPYGVHCSGPGTVYVVDSGNRRLQVLGGGGETLQQIRLEHGSYFDVAVSAHGLVALTGISSRSVEVYNRQGELLNAISNPFQNPRGITVNSRDQFLVTDTKRGTVSVLRLEPDTGRRLGADTVHGFHQPYFISANGADRVAVSERAFHGGCCVKVLDGGLRVLAVLGRAGSRPGIQLSNPWGVCIDSRGNVLVADWGRKHSLVLFPAHGPACVLVESGLSSPRGLALLRDGHVAVVDSMHHCIKVFRYQ